MPLVGPLSLVAGAGFEPAIRQLPDYEPDDLLFNETMTFQKLVAGAGFEPAIRRLPDYEPDGGVKPIIR